MIDRLEAIDQEIARRIRLNFRKNDCFPVAGHHISELKQHIMQLTELWYGVSRGGNISLLYSWFMKAMETMKVPVYSMDSIPQERSPDGWVNVVDGATRVAALKGKGSSDQAHTTTGGLSQKQGRS